MRARGRLIVLITVVIVVGLAALLAGACGTKRAASVQSRATQAAAGAPASRTLSPLPERALSPALDGVRRRLAQKVSGARELPWASEPEMIELTGWEYGTRAG